MGARDSMVFLMQPGKLLRGVETRVGGESREKTRQPGWAVQGPREEHRDRGPGHEKGLAGRTSSSLWGCSRVEERGGEQKSLGPNHEVTTLWLGLGWSWLHLSRGDLRAPGVHLRLHPMGEGHCMKNRSRGAIPTGARWVCAQCPEKKILSLTKF